MAETRRELHQQGFKTELAEFDFSTSDEVRVRVTALTNASTSTAPRNQEDAARRSLVQQVMPELMQTIGSDSAIPVWKQETWAANEGTATYLRLAGLSNDLWPALRETFNNDRAGLDKACLAALSGPIRFHLNASHGSAMLLPHLAALKNLTQTLGGRTVLELHEGNRDTAWTNVLAATRLVTAWEPEPSDISHLVRSACATLVFNLTWQTLQTNGWTDEQLARLQREWESVDFFKALPETAAFARACGAGSFQREREEPMDSFSPMLKDFFHSPKQAWANLSYWYQRVRYRQHGSYEDEKDILLYYRDREQQLRQTVQAHTWSEMRQLPGVTNNLPFTSKHHYSRTIALLSNRQMMLGIQSQGQGLLGLAAEAEARRRLIITAIALERFHGRHDAYPKSLEPLSPDLLKSPPVDFMDGQPLRYRLTADGHFVLYSVGLDCADNGGMLPSSRRGGQPSQAPPGFGIRPDTDLVWPHPASAEEIQAQAEQSKRKAAEAARAAQEREAAQEVHAEALRKTTVQLLLTEKTIPRATEPTYEGKPLSKLLQNKKAIAKATSTLDELLTLKQITTGKEPDIATFEVPVSYDVVTNIGVLDLLLDAAPENHSSNSESDIGVNPPSGEAELQACSRATNGNCLLVWNTTYTPPGQHALQARLLCTESLNDRNSFEVRGPVTPFYSSNICQFFPGNSMFDERGATLYAKLPESNGIYTIELKSPAGILIKTLKGTTSNGVINVEWDLKDENGKAYTNDSITSVFHVTLPDSKRSQTQKGQ